MTSAATNRSQDTPSTPPRTPPYRQQTICLYPTCESTEPAWILLHILSIMHADTYSNLHKQQPWSVCMYVKARESELTGSPCPVRTLVIKEIPTTGAEYLRIGADAANQTPLTSPSCTDSISVSQRDDGVLAAGFNRRFRTLPGSTSHISMCFTTLPVSCMHRPVK